MTVLEPNVCFHMIAVMQFGDWGVEASEAIRVTEHPNFAVGVQWHAEHIPSKTNHELSLRLFQEFGKAARQHAKARN